MKIIILVAFLAIIAVGNCTHLRTSDPNHQFLDFSNPLKLASLLSGDYVSLLPSFIQPIARKVLGQEQQSGVSGFLSKAQSFLGGNNSPTGGLLGGLGSLFGQSANQGNSGVSSLLNNFSGAFGQSNTNTNSNPLSGISGLGGLLNQFGVSLHE